MKYREFSKSKEGNYTRIDLGAEYKLLINNKRTKVIAVDGEVYFNKAGLSQGLVHFLNPKDKRTCLGFAGVRWFMNNASKIGESF